MFLQEWVYLKRNLENLLGEKRSEINTGDD